MCAMAGRSYLVGIQSRDGCPWGYREDFEFGIINRLSTLICKLERSTKARCYL